MCAVGEIKRNVCERNKILGQFVFELCLFYSPHSPPPFLDSSNNCTELKATQHYFMCAVNVLL